MIAEPRTQFQDEFIGRRIGPYTCVEIIGEGSFATVYKAVSQKDGLVVALKIIDKRRIREEPNSAVRQIKLKLVKTEAEILAKCDSKHVVRLYNRYQTDDHVILAMEFCNGGDLATQVQDREHLSENEAVLILKQIILGFAELHRQNVVHRDLKLSNIFRHNELYKIGDMGFATVIDSLQEPSLRTVLGSFSTMAPEVSNQRPYGTKADLWSLGIVYYQMLFGKVPSLGSLTGAPGERVDLSLGSLSRESREFLERALVPDPDLRLSWGQLYSLPLLQFRQGPSRAPSECSIKERHETNVDLDGSFIIHSNVETHEKERGGRRFESEMREIQNKTQANYSKVKVEDRRSSLSRLRSQLVHNEEVDRQIYRYVNQINFKTQKVLLLLIQIVEPLTKKATALSNMRQAHELAYLVCRKCVSIASPIMDALNRRANQFGWPYYSQFLESSYSQSFLREFATVYALAVAKLGQLDKLLLKEEGRLNERFLDFFRKHVYSADYERKDRMINGIEGMDFTENEQLEFVLTEYIQPLVIQINDMLEDTLVDAHRKRILGRLRLYLQRYHQILKAEFDPFINVLSQIVDAAGKPIHREMIVSKSQS